MHARLCVFMLVVTRLGNVAHAEQPLPTHDDDTNVASAPARSPFLRALVAPGEARADQLVRQGRALLYPALGLGLLAGELAAQRQLAERQLAIESALVRFEQAVHVAPAHREARLHLGKALSFWEERTTDGVLHDKTTEAIAQLEALRALDPLYEAQEVAFQLGLLFTRRGDFARAVSEYRHALAMRSDDADDTTLLENLAEVTMLSGDVAGSLVLYERATREGTGGGRVLALWGSAIALDRLGESTRALEQARRALAEDRAPFAVLHQGGVFFVPAHEVHYYEALGNLALADKEREHGESLSVLVRSARARRAPRVPTQVGGADAALPSTREARVLLFLQRARTAFTLYVQRDGGTGPFARDARDHITRLDGVLGSK